MSTTRTYSVGVNCSIRRLDNLTGPWIDVSRTPLTMASLFDVETDIVDADKVYTVGLTGSDSNGAAFYGILVSSDAGATWNQPSALVGGDYTTLRALVLPQSSFRFYEVSVVDANTIYACGDAGWVVKSTDGGQSFNKCTQLPAVVPDYQGSPAPAGLYPVKSIHFITPLIGVVGYAGNVFKTIDGGNTWSHLTSGPIAKNSSDYGGEFTGIFISQNSQTIVALGRTFGTPSRIFRSIDGGVTFNIVHVWQINGQQLEISGIHLTWTDDQHLWAFGEHQGRIFSVDGGATWNYYQIPSFSGINDYAGHYYSNTDGFYSEDKSIYQTLDGGNISKILSEISPFTVEALWTKLYAPAPPCYLVRDCEGVQPDFLTNSDLSAYVGKTINTCINLDPNLKTTRSPVPTETPVPPGTNILCYRFSNCCDPSEIIEYRAKAVDPVLWAPYGGFAPDFTGKTLVFYNLDPGKCWTFINNFNCGDPPPTTVNFPAVFNANFNSCEDCLSPQLNELASPCPPPPPPPPVDPEIPEVDPFYYVLTKCCNPEEQLVVTTGYIPNVLTVGQVVVISSISEMGDDCWVVNPVTVGTPTTGAIVINPNVNSILGFPNCDAARCACQRPWPNGCYCATVELAPNCVGSSPWPGVITEVFDSCELCKKECYILRDCEGNLPDQIVANDFSLMIGQVVKLLECPDVCWEVILCEDCECDCIKDIDTIFMTCEECLPPPPPPPPLELHPRKVKPGYDTPGCDPKYTEKVSCNFADGMYNHMLIDRYGVTICCEDERQKWEIKKQLLDFKAIYDPSLCVNFMNPCPTPCELLYFGTDNLVVEIVNTIPTPSVTLNFNDFFLSMIGGVAPFTYSMSKDGITWVSDTDPLNVFLTWFCANLGINTVYFRIEDSCDPVQSVVITSTLTILDTLGLCNPCASPFPVCNEGLIREIQESDTVEVFAQDFDGGSYDNPSNPNPGIASYEISLDGITYSPSIVFTCADVGNQIVIFMRVTNNCGASDFCETTIFIEDPMGYCLPCYPPIVICDEFLNVTIQPGGTVQILALDLNDGSYDDPLNVNPGIASYEISKDDITYSPSIIYTCEELGEQQAYMKITNNCGQSNTCFVNILVEDKDGNCP